MEQLQLVTDCIIGESPQYDVVDDVASLGLVGESYKKRGKTPVIRGPYGQADVVTANGRLYPLDEFGPSVEKIQAIIKKCLYGEFEHPKTHIVRPERAILRITKLWMDGNVLMGESVPAANQLGDWYTRIIMEDGYVLPMSIRALCKMKKQRGINICRDMTLCTVDAVVVNAASIAVPGVVYESVSGLAESGLITQEDANRIELFERKVDSKTALGARKRAMAALFGGLQAFGDLYKTPEE